MNCGLNNQEVNLSSVEILLFNDQLHFGSLEGQLEDSVLTFLLKTPEDLYGVEKNISLLHLWIVPIWKEELMSH